MKLLIIDDDQDTRRILQLILAAEGYEIVTAVDGFDGVARTRIDRPALVITDILMPRMDGFQYLSEIRKIAEFQDLPIVFYTGNYLDQEDELLARQLGVTRFLIKPLAPADIVSVVRELLGSRGTAATDAPSPAQTLEEPSLQKLYNQRLVTKLKHRVIENEDAKRSLESILEGLGDGIMVIDREHTILQANSALAASFGMEKASMIGRKCYEVSHKQQTPCEGSNIVCPHQMIFERGENLVKVLHSHEHAEGEEHQIEITATPLKDSKGRVFAIVETYRDIMDTCSDDELVKLVKRLNEAQTHLKHMSITDDLTGLRNRRYIIERLEEEFQRSKRSGNLLSLIMLDIDHFKQINDAHGHLFGDVVLRVVASRIKSSLRKHDIVGRVGGEEFLVICPDSSLEDTAVVAERIRQAICEQPIGDGIKEVMVALSSGVTAIQGHDHNSEKIFGRADAALYRAKEEGRNRVVVL